MAQNKSLQFYVFLTKIQHVSVPKSNLQWKSRNTKMLLETTTYRYLANCLTGLSHFTRLLANFTQ